MSLGLPYVHRLGDAMTEPVARLGLLAHSMRKALHGQLVDVPVSPKLDEWVDELDRIIAGMLPVPVMRDGEIVLELRGFALWQLFIAEPHGMTWSPVVTDVRALFQPVSQSEK